MEAFISLLFIVLVAFICPVLAHLIPRQPIPETVFLILVGMLLGPSCANLIIPGDEIQFLSELGLAFLFLLAGFEIDPKTLTGKMGAHAFRCWVVSFALGFGAVALVPGVELFSMTGLSLAIVLCTTALGTLMPILKERGLLGTPVGNAVLSYGTWGELGPVLAMALLLSARAKWQTVLVLVAFLAVALLAGLIPKRAQAAGTKLVRFLDDRRDSTSQTLVRATMVLLVGLVTLSAIFDLDIVLGAFAAGFVLRYITPASREELIHKIEAMAYGFFIPLFFIVSGAKIDITAVAAAPVMLLLFIVMLLVIRAIPVAVSCRLNPETRSMPMHHRATVALYCTTALPIIVAVTGVATKAGAMDDTTASVLVAAGAVTVLLMPLLTSVTYRLTDAHPVKAVQEIHHHTGSAKAIIREHWREAKEEVAYFEHLEEQRAAEIRQWEDAETDDEKDASGKENGTSVR